MSFKKISLPLAAGLSGMIAFAVLPARATAQSDDDSFAQPAEQDAADQADTTADAAAQLPPAQAAQSAGQQQDFDEEVPKDSFFDFDESEEAGAGEEAAADERTNWNDMINSSFGTPDEYEASAAADGAEPAISDFPKKPAKAETNLEILPPVEIGNRLIDASSLPMMAAFGNDDAFLAAWPTGKTWLTGQLPVSRTYNIKGCRFHLKTGPVSLAHYEKSGSEYVTITDSMRPMTTVRPEAGHQDLFLSANADLYPEVDAATSSVCAQKLKGKIIPIGKFDLGATALQLNKASMKYTVEVVDRSVVKPVQVYLYWPKGRSDPILIDNTGLYPVMSSPIYKVNAGGKGSGLVEVIPHLSYTKGGKALTREQLQEFWGER